MKVLLLILSFLTGELHAQSAIRGLGKYSIGVTTPDSLKGTGFKEEEQLMVKGTIALPCTHIRLIKAAVVEVSGVPVTDVSLYFYDNILFKLSCTYNDALHTAFELKHGEGILKPKVSVQYCTERKDKPMLIERKVWQKSEISAVAIHAKGQNAACEAEEVKQLIIFNRQVLALASDCELPNAQPVVAEFDNGSDGRK